MEDEKIVLSYKNSLLYEDDVSVLEKGRWINDSIFGFIFEYFAHEQFKAISKDICFIAPAVSQFLKLCQGISYRLYNKVQEPVLETRPYDLQIFDERGCYRTKEDISDFLEDLELQNKKYIIVAVNDSMLHDRIGGSHWSMMVFSKDHEKIFYFDSLGRCNLRHAIEIQRKIGLYFQGSDCGLYAICFAEEVCNRLLGNQQDFYNVDFTSDHAFRARERIGNLIAELAKNYESD